MSVAIPPELLNDINEILDELQTESDFGFDNGTSLNANGEVTTQLQAQGGDGIEGQAKSSGSYNVSIRWEDDSDNTIREENIASNVTGGDWTDINKNAKSAFATVVVSDNSGNSQTVDGTYHYK
jgi:hypothetical protein